MYYNPTILPACLIVGKNNIQDVTILFSASVHIIQLKLVFDLSQIELQNG